MPALGWPVDEDKRREIETQVGLALPFYRGSTKNRCSDCGLEIWIGPRVSELVGRGVPPVCIFCAVRIGRVIGLKTFDLGNPDTGSRHR